MQFESILKARNRDFKNILLRRILLEEFIPCKLEIALDM